MTRHEIEHADGSREVRIHHKWELMTGLGAAAITALAVGFIGLGVGSGGSARGDDDDSGGCSYGAPNTPTVGAAMLTGDTAVVLTGSVFVGTCDDTHDSTEIQVDTAGGNFSTPTFANLTGASAQGAITLDTIYTLTAASVAKARIRYKGAAAKSATWSSWSDTVQFTATVASAFMAEEFSYANTAALLSAYASSYAIDPSNTDKITQVDSGGIDFMRYSYPSQPSNCTDYYLTVGSMDWVDSTFSEIWVEARIRATNWVTQNDCGVGIDHKTILIGTDDGASGSGRFGLHVGYNDSQYDVTYPGSGDGSPGQQVAGVYDDNDWHVYRRHGRLGTGGTGANDFWIDGSIAKAQAVTTTNSTIDFLILGANLNQGPAVAMQLDWDYVRVYTSDPGWSGGS